MDERNPLFIVALGVAATLILWRLDYQSDVVTAAIVSETNERHSLPPEEVAYWRRHERNQSLCRGQMWISQCCEDGREDLNCLIPKEIK
jgi:hypothetical protein